MSSTLPMRLVLTVCLLIPGLLVPVLEVNATHLTNPAWPAHARLHEGWQLITNSALCAWALWLAWARAELRQAAVLGQIVIGGFLLAYLLRDGYGGSMAGTTTGALARDGVEPAVLIMSAAFLLLTAVQWQARRRH